MSEVVKDLVPIRLRQCVLDKGGDQVGVGMDLILGGSLKPLDNDFW